MQTPQRGDGVFWLAAAFAAPNLSARPLRWKMGVLIGLLAFSLGGAVLLEWLPGFNLFRVPSWMLLIAAFPIAYLAGTATDSLIASGWAAIPNRALSRCVLLVLLFAAVPSVSCVAMSLQQSPAPPWTEFVAYWVCIGLSLPAIVPHRLVGERGLAGHVAAGRVRSNRRLRWTFAPHIRTMNSTHPKPL